jgi:D-glycero-D-manno-heptose 1,7-bisphosphate phosphatase
MNKCVFLDRDGTIARDVPYCSAPEQFELLPGAGEGIRLFNTFGFKVILITNQSGVGRGYFSEEILGLIHEKMKAKLANFGAHIDAIYYCPHHPDENCDCRKPKPKLIRLAAKDFDIDLGRSYLIGDSAKDIEAGKAAGCKTILIGNMDIANTPKPDYAVANLLEAAKILQGSCSENIIQVRNR